jgi:hypothetical protein
MGRSVSYPSGANVAFRFLDDDEPDDDEGANQWAYALLCEEIRSSAVAAFPSFNPVDSWRGREDRVLLRNAYADIGVSTYSGIAAIWIAERVDPCYRDADARICRNGRARHWLAQVAPKFNVLFAQLDRVGHMSNGESVYRLRVMS